MGTQCVQRCHTIGEARLERDMYFPTGDIATVRETPTGMLIYSILNYPIIHTAWEALIIGTVCEITGLPYHPHKY